MGFAPWPGRGMMGWVPHGGDLVRTNGKAERPLRSAHISDGKEETPSGRAGRVSRLRDRASGGVRFAAELRRALHDCRLGCVRTAGWRRTEFSRLALPLTPSPHHCFTTALCGNFASCAAEWRCHTLCARFSFILMMRELADRVGFEPTEPGGSAVFKTAAFDRSATCP